MVDFTFYNPCEIVFGKDAETRAGEMVKRHGGHRVLLHYGKGSIKKNGLYGRVIASLNAEGIPWEELGGVVPNPRWSLSREGAGMCRDRKLDFILAVGGGSVIDSAKAMAAQAVYDGDLWEDSFKGGKEVTNALPVGTILTIPAAGSEMSDRAVITEEEARVKLTCKGDGMIPVFSLLNPSITFSLPLYHVACGVVDMLSHMMERYFTRVGHVTVTDLMLEGAMKSVVKLGPVTLREPYNYDIRSEIVWASTVAHNNFLGCGREGDWTSHRMEHELSALYDIAHGAGLAIMLPAWMRYVSQIKKTRVVRFATHVMGIPSAGNPDLRIISQGIAALEAFFRGLGMPTSFRDAGLPPDRIDEMTDRANRWNGLGNYVRLDKEDIRAIYRMAAEGRDFIPPQ
ncbi:MAG: iron-containing alcohol dehydrogenase [Oscillospiraceae bacterium]|nr:iron-containing alcohol dehydrogenase [Oscillospiraceae bacterium]